MPTLSRPDLPAAAVAAGISPAHKVSRLYRPELDALRFFAFFAVFLAHGVNVGGHTAFLAHHPLAVHVLDRLQWAGSFGLPVFFLLSSFLITTLLLLEKQRTGTLHVRSFYLRRMLRIWPLYLAFIAFCFALGHVWKAEHVTVGFLASYYLISANWYVLAAGFPAATIGPLWSISVEEQFYLVWPAAVRGMTPRGIQNFCLALLVASVGAIWISAARKATFTNLWFDSFVQMIFFAAGGLLALRYGLREQQPSAQRALAGVAVMAAAFLGADALIGHSESIPIPALRAIPCFLLIAAGASSMLWAFLHMPRRLLFPKLVYLGRISYGLYVFHMLCIEICRHFLASHLRMNGWLLAALLLTITLAVLSYEYFEKPFLRLKHRFELVHSRAA